MQTDETSLIEVLNLLKDAVETENWERAEKLDNEIKQNLKDAVSGASSEEERLALISMLQTVQSIYSLLISSSKASRGKVSDELKKLSKDKKAANFYLKSSQYR